MVCGKFCVCIRCNFRYWNMKRNFGIILSGVFLVLCACRHNTPEKEMLPTVKTDTVRCFQNELYITYPGKVKAASDVDLAFRIAGPILRMPAESGAFVRKGELVAEIDPRDYEVQLSATEAEYKQIKAEAERVIELYRRNSVPVNDYDKAVSGLQQITAKYNAHKNALKDTRLLAPFDGYIQKKYFEKHETVGAGIPVVSMINLGYFEVGIDIPSSDYVRREHFKSFACTFDVFPDREFPLELVEITRKANLNQLYRVRLRLKADKESAIAAGMSVNVTIEYEPESVVLTSVPATALCEEDGKASVWVYDPVLQNVKQRPVKMVKLLKDGQAVVYDGLKAGDIVVSAGVHRLKEGMKVKVLKSVSPTNVGGLL